MAARHWIVLADQAQARIYEVAADRPLHPIHKDPMHQTEAELEALLGTMASETRPASVSALSILRVAHVGGECRR
jgi:hypothetical protein